MDASTELVLIEVFGIGHLIVKGVVVCFIELAVGVLHENDESFLVTNVAVADTGNTFLAYRVEPGCVMTALHHAFLFDSC